MNCADFRLIAPLVLYRDVDPAARQRGRTHLDGCAECRAYFAPLQERLCSEIHAALDDYLDRTMDPGERATFDAHLAVCPECRDYLSSYAATIRLGRSAHAADPPPPPSELVAAVLAARKKAPPPA